MYEQCARDGIIVPIAGGNHIPKEWAHYPIAAGIKPEEWDGFHDFILWDELYRGSPTISSAFVGLVCVLEFGHQNVIVTLYRLLAHHL